MELNEEPPKLSQPRSVGDPVDALRNSEIMLRRVNLCDLAIDRVR